MAKFLETPISLKVQPSSELGYQIVNDKYVYYLFKQNCIHGQTS